MAKKKQNREPEPQAQDVAAVVDFEPADATSIIVNPEPEQPAAEPRYFVTAGHAIAVSRGVRGSGEEVTLRDFGGGAPALEKLIASGHIEQR